MGPAGVDQRLETLPGLGGHRRQLDERALQARVAVQDRLQVDAGAAGHVEESVEAAEVVGAGERCRAERGHGRDALRHDPLRLAGGVEQLGVVTLGTVFNQTPGVMESVLDGLAQGPWAVLATVGPNRNPAALGPQAGRVRVEQFVPHADVLPFCDGVVSHGGFGTTIDALHAGLPHVVIPLTADQPLHAAAVDRLGLGRLVDWRVAELNPLGLPQVDPGSLTPAIVRDAVENVLRSAADHASAIARIQREIAQLPGPASFVDLVEDLATQGPLVGQHRWTS